jgi:hypothetical protein
MKKSPIYCFTPLAVLITFLVEFSLSIYVFIKHRKTMFGQVIASLLLCLSLFQLSEYVVCTTETTGDVWMRVGYISITLLPALGMHLVQIINHKQPTILNWIADAFALGLSLFIAFASESIYGYTCTGKFVVFELNTILRDVHGVFYGVFLCIAMVIMVIHIWKNNNRRINSWLLAGYLVFIVPSVAMAIIAHNYYKGLASIMCGFAIILAVILVWKVVPLYFEEKS